MGAGSLRAGDEGLPGIPRAEEGDWPAKGRDGEFTGVDGGQVPEGVSRGVGVPEGRH